MKKVNVVPFHTLYEINDNMYENVIIVSKKSREIISENSLDLQKLEEGFESTEEIKDTNNEDYNKEKAIITATNDFVEGNIDWEKEEQD